MCRRRSTGWRNVWPLPNPMASWSLGNGPGITSRFRNRTASAREKSTGLSPEVTLDLDHYLQIEHLMRLARL
jgi:hypothetical protein